MLQLTSGLRWEVVDAFCPSRLSRYHRRLYVSVVFLFLGAADAGQCALWLIRSPLLARQVLFERRLKRIRPGTTSQFVRSVLGAPARVDGFGDRLYWSYRIAGQRYTVSFDPRRLVAKYSNGLARDLPRQVA